MHLSSQNIIESFASQSKGDIATQQKAHIKNKLEFFGLTFEVRKNELKLPFTKVNRQQKEKFNEVVLFIGIARKMNVRMRRNSYV